MQVSPGNQEAIEAWNSVLFDKFVAFREILTSGLGAHGEAALTLYPPATGARVIDLGCGFGDTATRIGELVGPTGSVIGVDAAARFIDTARTEAETAGVRNVRFAVADVEAALPDGPFDLAFSRFGTMFFNSPVRALRNVKTALVPGGRLVMVVWRRKDANEAVYRAELIARDILGEPEKNDQVTCGPGPFSMASSDVTSDILTAAGFREITFTRSDASILVGKTIEDAIGFALTIGPAGEIVRLAGDAATAKRPELVRALGEVFAGMQRPDGVWGDSSSWIVSARNPA